jgi:hypothetical protein
MAGRLTAECSGDPRGAARKPTRSAGRSVRLALSGPSARVHRPKQWETRDSEHAGARMGCSRPASAWGDRRLPGRFCGADSARERLPAVISLFSAKANVPGATQRSQHTSPQWRWTPPNPSVTLAQSSCERLHNRNVSPGKTMVPPPAHRASASEASTPLKAP